MISVIVPIYNTNEYLTQCVESILNQSYTELEVILIDDGSTDGSGNTCDFFCEKDRRVQVVHQSNQGLSAARNTGIDLAKGEYLSFVDSDDTIHKDFYRILMFELTKHNAQLAMCNILLKTDSSAVNKAYDKVDVKILNKSDALNFMTQVQDNVIMSAAWNKIYRRELFENIRYPIGKLHEDEFVIHEILWHVETVAWCDAELYEYLIRRSTGITATIKNRTRYDKIEALWSRVLFFRDLNEEYWFTRSYDFFLAILIWRYKGLKEIQVITRKQLFHEKIIFIKAFYDNKRARLPLKKRCKYFVYILNLYLYEKLEQILVKKSQQKGKG